VKIGAIAAFQRHAGAALRPDRISTPCRATASCPLAGHRAQDVQDPWVNTIIVGVAAACAAASCPGRPVGPSNVAPTPSASSASPCSICGSPARLPGRSARRSSLSPGAGAIMCLSADEPDAGPRRGTSSYLSRRRHPGLFAYACGTPSWTGDVVTGHEASPMDCRTPGTERGRLDD